MTKGFQDPGQLAEFSATLYNELVDRFQAAGAVPRDMAPLAAMLIAATLCEHANVRRALLSLEPLVREIHAGRQRQDRLA